MRLSTDRLVAEVSASAGAMAGIVADSDPAIPVPACPDWTLRQLATHVGRVHRWATEIVRTQAREAVAMRAVPDGEPPGDPGGQAAWLRSGAARLAEALRAAGPGPVWAFGSLAPPAFWARRQAHETMVHRADAQLAVGQPVVLDPELAADAIDEWLTVMAGPRYGRPDARSGAFPPGTSLRFVATADDQGVTASRRWLISQDAGRVTVSPEPVRGTATADLTVSGPPDQVLLLLVRRLAPEAAAITVAGDQELLAGWLAGTPF